MARRRNSRFFALAAGVGLGVWFGVVLAAGRADQARELNENSNAACFIGNFNNPSETAGMPGESQALQGCRE